MRVNIVAKRAWWVTPFMLAMLIPAWVTSVLFPSACVSLVDWVGRVVATHGYKTSVQDAN